HRPSPVLPALALRDLSSRADPVPHLDHAPREHAGRPEALSVPVPRGALSGEPPDDEHLPAWRPVEDRPGVTLVTEAGLLDEALEVEGIRPSFTERSELLRAHRRRRHAPEEPLQFKQRHDLNLPWGGPLSDGTWHPLGSSTS